MIITHKIKMDLSARGITPRVDAVQDDAYSRNLELSLYANGEAWTPPSGAAAVVRFKKPDGTGGNYDTLPDGTAACAISGSVLTVALAPQVCTAEGLVLLAVGLISGDAEINTFTVCVNVQPNPGIDVQSESYYKIAGSLADSGWTPDMYLGTDENGYVVVKEVPGGAVVAREIVENHLIPIASGGDQYDNHRNLFNPDDDNVTMGYIAAAGQINSSESYWTTGYIPVSAGDVIRTVYDGTVKQMAYIAEYSEMDQSGLIVRTVAGSYTSYTVENDCYIRICVKISAIAFENAASTMVTANDTDCTFIRYGAGNYGNDGLMSAEQARKLEELSNTAQSAAPRSYDKFYYTAYSSFGSFPPNSVPHFEYGAKNNYDWMKCDIRPASDGGLICCHDAGFTLDANGRVSSSYDSGNATLIHDLTTAECTALEFAKTPDGTYYHVCTLDDFLAVCKKYGKTPFITIRDEYISDVVAPNLVAALKKFSLLENAVINSGTRDSLTAVRALAPSVTMCLFFNPFGSSMGKGYDYCLEDGNTIASFYYNTSGYTWDDLITNETVADYIALCHENGIPMIACIESDDSHTDALIAMGFSGCHTTQVRTAETVTSDTVQNMIDASLGVIENGAY